MKLRSIFHILICVLMLTILSGITGACVNDGKVEALLDNADTLVKDYPDSVLAILDGMNEEIMDCPKSQRMRYELLRADAQNKVYVDFTTDSVMKEVVGYYDDQGTANQRMKANYLLGCTYRDMGESPLALEYYQKAVECADTTAEDCDFYNLASIYGQMADLFYHLHLPYDELDYLKKYENIAIYLGDSANIISAYELRIRPYYILNMKDSVLSIIEKARDMRKKFHLPEETFSLGTALSIHVSRSDYPKAKEVLEEFESELEHCKLNSYDSTTISLYFHSKGLIALHDRNYSLAEKCFYDILNTPHKVAAYNGLMRLYMEKNTLDSVIKYSQLYVTEKDSDVLKFNATEVIRINSMYKYGRMQKKARISAELYARSENIKTQLVALLVVVLIILILTRHVYRKVRTHQLEEIRYLTRELSASKKEYIIAENKRRIELQSIIQQYEEKLSKMRSDLIEDTFFTTDIYCVFKNNCIANKLSRPITHSEWEELTKYFHSYFDSFIGHLLIHKPLNDDQFKVCILMRLHFKESEICNLMNVSSSRLNKLKMQINEKLFSVSDSKSLRENLSRYC